MYVQGGVEDCNQMDMLLYKNRKDFPRLATHHTPELLYCMVMPTGVVLVVVQGTLAGLGKSGGGREGGRERGRTLYLFPTLPEMEILDVNILVRSGLSLAP